MKSPVDAATVARVAKLAHIALSPEATEKLVGDLQRILDYAESLQKLALEDVPPTSHAVTLTCPTRGDDPVRDPIAEKVLAAAPEHEGTAFKVPKIIE
ncbi:MAG: Asp-tRNA(Asn)/Glu-tRNA(Gln) amidotransferase subunit GatC [Deltaproteobacteria bacterium]|nr:Asp-tRNA(Asn)/Glu-tRNA(Gln) amidotransferase subunit GatC [Deltaproteobacteria bacterium]